MLEWNRIPTTTFINPLGDQTQVKLIYKHELSSRTYMINTQGKDLDLIAFEELGSSSESLNLLQNNAQKLCEYDFDMNKISELKIPI
jgi:hypothetical protein